MTTLTDKDKIILTHTMRFAKLNQLFIWFLWELFCNRKSKILIDNILIGMSFESAFEKAKKQK